MKGLYWVLFMSLFSLAHCTDNQTKTTEMPTSKPLPTNRITLNLEEANRLAQLPLSCIQTPLPYKSGIVITSEGDLAMPQVHHPAFYGCFDWHSAVHGHWSLVYLLKTFPELADAQKAKEMLNQNLTKENIEKEVAYFTMNSETKNFERTYGWAWLLKLAEELHTWEDPQAKIWLKNLEPLVNYITSAYVTYLPKLVYPIRVGEHSNTGFGMSFAYDYARTTGHTELAKSIKDNALRFYSKDAQCPISWEPSGYDFLSPCLQEMDIMRKVLSDSEFESWSRSFLPELFNGQLELEPGKILDRADGKLVHLDGLNFSRAWCLYSLKNCPSCIELADKHLKYSLDKITDGDYAGQHWLASFALYAFKCQGK